MAEPIVTTPEPHLDDGNVGRDWIVWGLIPSNAADLIRKVLSEDRSPTPQQIFFHDWSALDSTVASEEIRAGELVAFVDVYPENPRG